jgi:uncharacterized protein YutD
MVFYKRQNFYAPAEGFNNWCFWQRFSRVVTTFDINAWANEANEINRGIFLKSNQAIDAAKTSKHLYPI